MKANPVYQPVEDSLGTSKSAFRFSELRLTRRRHVDLRAVAAVASALVLAAQAQASTSVSGIVDGQTWTTYGSPYTVVGDVLVSQLEIQPGVEVSFQGSYEFQVAGILKAQGTAQNPVWFHAVSGKAWRGIFFNESPPGSAMTYCRVEGSTNSGIRIQNSLPAISDCVIANNSSPTGGGGLNCVESSSTITISRCTITNNAAKSRNGGGVSLAGSGTLSRCTITDNVASWGGGVYLTGSGMLRSCLVARNTAGDGGAVAVDSSSYANLINCIIVTNYSSVVPGAVFLNFANAAAVNCTILGNDSAIGNYGSGTVGVTNSILYFNGSPFRGDGTEVIAYSDIQGGIQPGPGNISENPVLNPATYALLTTSPCIDAGKPSPAFNDTCYPPSRGTARNDMGAYGGPWACDWLEGEAPAIVAQPESRTSCLDGTVTFSVGASGAEPLAYQWFFQTGAIAGQTNVQLTLTDLQPINSGAYYVTVSNQFGSATSAVAQLIVYDPCIDLHMYAGLTISGQQGSRYVVSYNNDLGNTNGWVPLATNVMDGSIWFYLDMDSPFVPHRFYKASRAP